MREEEYNIEILDPKTTEQFIEEYNERNREGRRTYHRLY